MYLTEVATRQESTHKNEVERISEYIIDYIG